MLRLKEHEARARRRVTRDPVGESLTLQSERDEADINRIVGKYRAGALVEHVNKHQGDYADYTGFPQTYFEAMQQVVEANEMFDSIPADIRKRFNNDPQEFLDFVSTPGNRDELVKMGLAKAPLRAETPDEATLPLPLEVSQPETAEGGA